MLVLNLMMGTSRRTCLCLSALTFFGLTSNYRSIIFQQIHDLVYHGGGGFIHSEVYNMPVWKRKFHILAINKYVEEQKEEQEKLQKQHKGNSGQVLGPNIAPSSTYNFKK